MTKTQPPQPEPDAQLHRGYREIPPEYHAITTREVFTEFWNHARGHKRAFVFIGLSTLMQGGVAGGTIYLLKHALDRFFDHADVSSILFLLGTLFLATVFKSALEFVFNWNKSLAVARIHDTLVVRAFRDLLYNPFRFHITERDRHKYGWVLSDSMKFTESFFGMFNAWGRQPVVLLSTIAALWVISPLLTVVGIVLVPLGIPCVVILKRNIKVFVEQRQRLLGRVEEIVAETIRTIRIVKVFGLEERHADNLRRTIDRQREVNLKNAFHIGLMAPLSELLGFIGLAVIIVAGSQKIVGGAFGTGTFFVFIMAFLAIYRALKEVSSGYMNYQLALDAGRRLIVLRQRAAEAQQHSGTIGLKRFDRLEIENLWFTYTDHPADDSDWVLRNLSMTIERGGTIAIVGTTGAGKSTLCDLICHLYQPNQGTIRVNGHPMDDIVKDDLSQVVALCSQETIVFNNSLVDEITVACPEASREAVGAAARASGLSDYLNTIGRDLDSWVGDRGIQFSGGQRQMIAIARALLRQPQLLILDEAMSGLDMETSRTIWVNIREALPEAAIVVVSHNWDIIKNCQTVLVLQAGRIVTSMPVADIQDKDQFFRELHLPKSRPQPIGVEHTLAGPVPIP